MNRWSQVLSLVLGFGVLAIGLQAAEQSKQTSKPKYAYTIAFQYPSVVLNPDDTVSIDLIVKNRGQEDLTVWFKITQEPTNWVAEIKRYGTIINGIFIASDETQTLTFSARPKDKKLKRLPPGTYKFTIEAEAQTPQGRLVKTTSTTVTVQKPEQAQQKIVLETSYPVLRGASDEQFEFSLDVRNDSDQDAVFNFQAEAPKGWEVSFKPAYESKQISSLQISSQSSRTVNVEVTPPYNVEPGEYTIKVRVECPKTKAQAEKDLKVIITGKYDLTISTPTGLLSYPAERGKEISIPLLVKNSGSAPQREISFTSFAPENWKVKFDPEKLEDLQPGDIKQVQVKITPAEKALIGDYSVAIQANGEKANDSVEFRITVKAPTIWGWVGVGLIALVIVGMAITFQKLGRR